MACKELISIGIYTCLNNIKTCITFKYIYNWYMIHFQILYVNELII
jgi:hypothetical protein